MKRAPLYLVLAVLVVAWGRLPVHADEMDDVLQVEQMMEAEALPGTDDQDMSMGGTAPAAGADMAGKDPSMLSREDLVAALEAAWAEVERMKDIVRRIRDANRREKETMHYNVGCVFRNAGHYRKAEAAFRKALAINPHDPAVHYNLGILYDEDLGMPAKAKQHYRVFLELAPQDEDAGQVYQWLTALE